MEQGVSPKTLKRSAPQGSLLSLTHLFWKSWRTVSVEKSSHTPGSISLRSHTKCSSNWNSNKESSKWSGVRGLDSLFSELYSAAYLLERRRMFNTTRTLQLSLGIPFLCQQNWSTFPNSHGFVKRWELVSDFPMAVPTKSFTEEEREMIPKFMFLAHNSVRPNHPIKLGGKMDFPLMMEVGLNTLHSSVNSAIHRWSRWSSASSLCWWLEYFSAERTATTLHVRWSHSASCSCMLSRVHRSSRQVTVGETFAHSSCERQPKESLNENTFLFCSVLVAFLNGTLFITIILGVIVKWTISNAWWWWIECLVYCHSACWASSVTWFLLLSSLFSSTCSPWSKTLQSWLSCLDNNGEKTKAFVQLSSCCNHCRASS